MLAALRSRPLVEQALLVAAIASGALIAGALLFERVWGYAPCALCLDQREAHWTALALAAVGVVAGVFLKLRRAAAATVGALALVYLVSAGLAFYHAGVEHRFWPGPATCAGGGPVELGDRSLTDVLDEKPAPPACEDAAWRFLGVSMAGYNLLASAGLFVLCFVAVGAAANEARRARSSGP